MKMETIEYRVKPGPFSRFLPARDSNWTRLKPVPSAHAAAALAELQTNGLPLHAGPDAPRHSFEFRLKPQKTLCPLRPAESSV